MVRNKEFLEGAFSFESPHFLCSTRVFSYFASVPNVNVTVVVQHSSAFAIDHQGMDCMYDEECEWKQVEWICVCICADSIPLHLNISRRKYDPCPGVLHLKDIFCVTSMVGRNHHEWGVVVVALLLLASCSSILSYLIIAWQSLSNTE